MSQILTNDIPQLITEEVIREIVKLSNIVELSKEHKSFLSRMIKKYDSTRILYEESNIPKTLDNINEDINKSSFTGKELKDIIATHKFNQYNLTLLKVFKEMAEVCYQIQYEKESDKLIESVDVFTILYIVKFIQENNENVVFENTDSLFYKKSRYSSIFELEEEDNNNPFIKFLNCFENNNYEIRTEALIDTQKIDSLFFIE